MRDRNINLVPIQAHTKWQFGLFQRSSPVVFETTLFTSYPPAYTFSSIVIYRNMASHRLLPRRGSCHSAQAFRLAQHSE